MPYKFSPSSLELLGSCPRCFWLRFNKRIMRPEGISMSLPSGMDKVLKKHFDSFRARGALPPELRDVEGVALFDNQERINVWRNNFKGLEWVDNSGNRVHGAIDDVLVKGKRLIILDFKTRGFALKEDTAAFYQDKLDMYAFLFERNGYDIEPYAYLLFYYPKHVLAHGDVAFHSELVKLQVSSRAAEKVLGRALDVLAGPMPTPNAKCAFCGWHDTKF